MSFSGIELITALVGVFLILELPRGQLLLVELAEFSLGMVLLLLAGWL